MSATFTISPLLVLIGINIVRFAQHNEVTKAAHCSAAYLTSKSMSAASPAAGEEGVLKLEGSTLSLDEEAPPSAAESLHSLATKPQDEMCASLSTCTSSNCTGICHRLLIFLHQQPCKDAF